MPIVPDGRVGETGAMLLIGAPGDAVSSRPRSGGAVGDEQPGRPYDGPVQGRNRIGWLSPLSADRC